MRILKKPLAIYFEILKYSHKNIEYIEENFQILKLENPSQLLSLKEKQNVKIIFAPLGYNFNMILFKKFPNLKILVSNTTSIPHINESDAKLMNIKICALHDEMEFLDTITPTAEHTIGLIVAASRRIIGAHQSVLKGTWERKNWGSPFMLSRAKLGIIGFGRLGRMVAKIASSIGMEINWYDPNCSSGEYNKSRSLIDIAETCDVISLHAKHNDSNTNFINKQFFDAMKPSGIFVNTARGELVDNIALLNALKNRQIWGAALDTIKGEFESNLFLDQSFKDLINYAKCNNNLIITPHIAGSTFDAWYETEAFVIKKAINFLSLI